MRVVVAMSGGVDSSVAAAILKENGHEVIGVTLKLQDCHEARASRSCCGSDGIVRARAVAGQLGIPHYVADFVRKFETEVLLPSWVEYATGRTPSPCLLCNERIKFGVLLEWSRHIGASRLASGHYVQTEVTPEGGINLLRGEDPDKDQSYFLAGLAQDQLKSLLFPIGHMRKAEVRRLGSSMGLSTAETHDSQDACLVGPDQSFAEALRQRFSAQTQTGSIVDKDGTIVGRHDGIHHFTVGQRSGLGVPSIHRLWVKAVRAEDNAIVVTANVNDLLSRRFTVNGVSWIAGSGGPGQRTCEVQVRYRHEAKVAVISALEDGIIAVEMLEPVRAVAPGQAAVFYDGRSVLGRGWIHAC